MDKIAERRKFTNGKFIATATVAMCLVGSVFGVGTATANAAPSPQVVSSQATQTISGKVTDSKGEPVIGANIMEKGTNRGVVTDLDGKFTLKVAPGATITVSFLGFQSQTLKAQERMNVVLKDDNALLDEVVVVGFGTQKRANLTGAVSSVDVSKAMDNRPITDAAKALQGAVPGLTITSSNGDITAAPSIKIRGTGTLSNDQKSDPLIVVDGVPVEDLSYVNPDDIAEISVLKDAASSAIYGTRAAFGVILITTKGSSSKDKVSINYSNNFAWSQATTLPTMATNVTQMKTALQPTYRGAGDREIFGLYFEELLPYMEKWEAQHSGPYTDVVELQPYVDDNNVGDYYVKDGVWLRYADWDIAKTLYNNAAPSQKHNLSVDGTSGKTNYRLSFGYDKKQGLMEYNPDKVRRYMANANISTEIFSWLKAGTRISFTNRDYRSPNLNRNSYQYAWRWPGFFESYGYIRDENGDPEYTRSAVGFQINAPVDKTVTTSTRMQAWLQADIYKDLSLYADFTYSIIDTNSSSSAYPYYMWNTWTTKAPSQYSPYSQATSYAAQSNSKDDMWTMNVYATYNHTWNDAHNLKVMVGAMAEREEYNYFYAKRTGLTDYNLPNLDLTNGTTYTTEASNTARATAGFFGRINYDYKGIYLFEANGRYDGSSRFPANDQWAFFPSFSAGYRFSEEAYFENLKQYISNGKIRASYGHIGNEAVGSYRFLSTVSQRSTGNVHWIENGQKITQYLMPTIVPASLTWERVETTDIGIDLGFLNNEINLGFDWYQRDTKDMLGPAQTLPAVLGTTAPYSNNGTLRTRGWELSLSYNHRFGDVDFYATFNLSDARTKIQKWNNPAGTLYTYNPSSGNYTEGQYYGDIWGFETDRYFTEDDFNGKDADGNWIYKDGVADQTGLQSGSFVYGPGDVKFVDQNGDGKIDGGKGTVEDHGDLKVIGNALPRFEYALRLGAAWKGFDIDVFLQGVGQRKLWTTGSLFIPMAQSNLGVFDHQLSYNKYVVDANGNITGWEINQDNDYPNMYPGASGTGKVSNIGRGCYNFYPQSKYLVNMAYLRVKNITFGYTLPKNITRKALIEKARIYFSGENLFFLYNGASKYNMDPEINQSYSSTAVAGVDDGYAAFGRTVPMQRSYSFGVQVTF
ncbi:MAG: SusC/RagA family TonB-linked outer membrane protein [Candidatus Limisoma sp.]